MVMSSTLSPVLRYVSRQYSGSIDTFFPITYPSFASLSISFWTIIPSPILLILWNKKFPDFSLLGAALASRVAVDSDRGLFDVSDILSILGLLYSVWELYNEAMSESICSFSYLSGSLWIAVMKDRFGEIDSSLRVSLRIGESPGVGSKGGKRRLGMGKGRNISLSDSLGSDLSSGVVVKCVDDPSWDLFGGVSFEGIVGDELFSEVGYIDWLVSFPDGVTCVKASVVRCGVRLKSVSSWDWVFVTRMLRLIITSH
jgi:hypothetical protein